MQSYIVSSITTSSRLISSHTISNVMQEMTPYSLSCIHNITTKEIYPQASKCLMTIISTSIVEQVILQTTTLYLLTNNFKLMLKLN